MILIKATIRYTNSHPKIKKPFIKDPEPWLITQYHNQANRIRMKVQQEEEPIKIEHVGRYTMLYKGLIVDRSLSEVI